MAYYVIKTTINVLTLNWNKMKTNYTKGKWKVMDGHEGSNMVSYIQCNEATVATCFRINVSDEEGKANARLISKAPELLQSVIKLRNCLEILINTTPSGGKRNSLTDENILTLKLIDECIG